MRILAPQIYSEMGRKSEKRSDSLVYLSKMRLNFEPISHAVEGAYLSLSTNCRYCVST